MNITVIGHVCIDYNISEGVTYKTAGGPATFIARIHKRFPESKIRIITPYGTDFLPHADVTYLHPQQPRGDKTLMYINTSHGNLRTQKALNREYAQPVPIDEMFISHLKTSDVVFYAPLTPSYGVEYVKTCLSHVPSEALKIILPQGYYRDFTDKDDVIQRTFIEANELISFFDFVIVSEQDHQDMLSITRKWAQEIKVIMTMGDKGAMYLDKEHSYIASTKAVSFNDIVDSVGSGDIFSASFGYKYHLTKDVHKSLEFANNIARQCLFSKSDNLQFILPR